MNICLVKIYHTDLAHLKKLNLSNLHWICHLVNDLKKNKAKSCNKYENDFNYDSSHRFYKYF